MEKVIILGSANAISDEQHENSHLVINLDTRAILVDCVGNPIVRLNKAGVDHHKITDIILTHFHPDHVSGFPLLMLDMWLLGRKTPINIYGLPHTISRAEKMMDLFDWDRWPGFFDVKFLSLAEEPNTTVISDSDVLLTCSPVKHLLPTIGLRFDIKKSGKVLVYSCDTEPTEAVVDMARGADILIHEATGESIGHSSPKQCGEIASKAGVKKLYLIHYPTNIDTQKWIHEAKSTFNGDVELCTDLMTISLEA